MEPALVRTSEGNCRMTVDFPLLVSSLRTTTPLVQCITNHVVSNFTANMLLAAGATPAMMDFPGEAKHFATEADAVLINAGTPSLEQFEGMREAAAGASESGTPWVIDPVGIGGLPRRSRVLLELLELHPTAIRGNASEIIAYAGLGTGGRGTDSTNSPAEALEAAHALVQKTGGVVAISGATDLIVSPDRVTELESGDAMLQTVIGTGCSLGALTAAYLGTGAAAHDAVVAAHAHVGAAAQRASTAGAPGSFAVQLVDEMFLIDGSAIHTLVSVKDVH